MKHTLVDGDDPLTIQKFCPTYLAFELRRVLEPPCKEDAVRVELESSAGTAQAGFRKARVGGRHADHYRHHDVKDREYWLASPKREDFSGLSV